MRLPVAAAALAATMLVAGCGGESTSAPTATPGAQGAQIQVGDTINYGSFGTTAEIDCADGKSLNVGGSNNTLTVRGTCTAVNIGGADNKLTLDKVDKDLSVIGLNNTVIYRDGDPKVDNLGSGNDIKKE